MTEPDKDYVLEHYLRELATSVCILSSADARHMCVIARQAQMGALEFSKTVWAFYTGLRAEGAEHDQALALTTAWMLSMFQANGGRSEE